MFMLIYKNQIYAINNHFLKVHQMEKKGESKEPHSEPNGGIKVEKYGLYDKKTNTFFYFDSYHDYIKIIVKNLS